MKNTINREIRTEIKTEINKERVTAMKKVSIIILAIGILVGAALCAVLLKGGNITIREAAAGFAYVIALRVGTMLAARRSKKAAAAAEEKTLARPLTISSRLSPQETSSRKPAA